MVRNSTNKENFQQALVWLTIFAAVLLWSIWLPKDWPTWWLESLPALVAAPLTLYYRVKDELTPLVFWLILCHAVVLMIGAHYTYAEVPFFTDLQHLLGQDRNNYDKLGHLLQGLVPAMIAREVLLRKRVVPSRGWMSFFILCFVLALSASYELIEWGAAMVSEKGAEAFLGTQGDVWDTQTDMLFALIGGILALGLLTKLHDKQLSYISDK